MTLEPQQNLDTHHPGQIVDTPVSINMMYMCMYIRMYVCMYAYIYVSLCVCVYACMYVYVQTHAKTNHMFLST